MPDAPQLPPIRPLVLSLHGIRTRGAWQKELTEAFAGAGLDYVALDYEYYGFMNFIRPSRRKKQMTWFLQEYTRVAQDRTPSIIAHSFGTYLVARAMQKYAQVKFERIIFCGSIVQRGYPWSTRYKNGQFKALLNDYGRRDIPAWLAAFIVYDVGPSGVFGFTDKCSAIVQREHSEFGHSDHFYALNYKEVWIPFLRGETPAAITSDIPEGNKRFWIGMAGCGLVAAAILVGLLYVCYLVYAYVRGPEARKADRAEVSIEQFMEQRARSSGGAVQRDYLGKEVEWDGVVVSTSPEAKPPCYVLKPNEQSRLGDWVQAEFAPDDFRHLVKPGDKIRVIGVIESIGPSLTVLRDCKIVD